jgi:hypothetical protein
LGSTGLGGEATREAQARIDQERANTEAGEIPFNMGAQREAAAEAEREVEAEAEA